jgi:hypothetical protein
MGLHAQVSAANSSPAIGDETAFLHLFLTLRGNNGEAPDHLLTRQKGFAHHIGLSEAQAATLISHAADFEAMLAASSAAAAAATQSPAALHPIYKQRDADILRIGQSLITALGPGGPALRRFIDTTLKPSIHVSGPSR